MKMRIMHILENW